VEKYNVSVGEKPVVTMDVENGIIKLSWKTSLLCKSLNYDIERCVGCTLCLPCPWEAITKGPIAETAAGRIEGAPLVNVDPDLCTFCGLCESSCIFGAFDAIYEGEGSINDFNIIEGTHEIDEEKCAPCLLCAKVCPTEALVVDISVDKKKDLVKYKGEVHAKGSIKVDEDKCSYCGLCELLCPEAIKIFWSEKIDSPRYKPAIAIKVIEEECDYCGLCEKICPDEAIKVECTESSKRTIQEPKITGKLTRDDNQCVKCGLCEVVCPYDAIKVEKPFTGEVKIKNLEKCDPTGCNNCFNICPVKAIYPTGTADKIAVADDYCMYCGACENACPYEVLEVHRDGYHVTELQRARAWESARKRFFDAVIGKSSSPSNLYARDIVIESLRKPKTKAKEEVEWDSGEARKETMNRVKKIRAHLKKNPQLHLQLERGQTDKVKEELKSNRIGSPKK